MTCRQCFRGDYWEPPSMCGDCEAALEEAQREVEVTELENERDEAFDALIETLEANHVS